MPANSASSWSVARASRNSTSVNSSSPIGHYSSSGTGSTGSPNSSQAGSSSLSASSGYGPSSSRYSSSSNSIESGIPNAAPDETALQGRYLSPHPTCTR